MIRLAHFMVLCLVFASMWLHGGVAFAQEEMSGMDMSSMGSSCLQHCLDAVHVDEADDGLAQTSVTLPIVEHMGVRSGYGLFSWRPPIDSHHDPSRVLTTIKRE